jgi:hypothetical protein
MTKSFLCLLAAMLVCAGCVNIESEEKSTVVAKHSCQKSEQVLRHVVLFKFKDGTTPEQIKGVENAFAALPGKISAIHDFEWGTNVSIENRSEGFTHCFVVTFLNEAGRGEYLPHPAHKEFGKMLGPYLEKVLVLDYWLK